MGARRAVRRTPPRHGIRRLERLVRDIGAGETARRAGVSEATLRRWAKTGVSIAGREGLLRVEKRREAAKIAAQAARSKREQERARESRKRREAEERREAAKVAAQAARSKREQERARESQRQKADRVAASRRERAELIRKGRESQVLATKKAREEALRQARAKVIADAKAKLEANKRAQKEALEIRKRAETALKRKKEAEAAEKTKRAEEGQLAKKELKGTERERRMRLVAEACRLMDNNNTSISQAVGVDEKTIRRWMKNPPMSGDAFKTLQKIVEDIHTLLALMKAAGETEKLPVVRPGAGRRSGMKTDGVFWTRLYMRRMTPEVLRLIVKWMRSRPGKFYPYWQAVAVTSQFLVHGAAKWKDITDPKNTDISYKTVVVQFGHQKWGDFAVTRLEPTSQQTSSSAMVKDFETRFRNKLEAGDSQVFVHGVTVFAYRRRSDAEQKSWSSARRKERHETWKKRQ